MLMYDGVLCGAGPLRLVLTRDCSGATHVMCLQAAGDHFTAQPPVDATSKSLLM